MVKPEEFRAELKEKWLNYYQANRGWLQDFANQNESWFNPVKQEEKLEDSDYSFRRPEARFILGVISAIEPKVQGFLPYAVHLNTDPNCIVKALGLDFDPELELQKREKRQSDSATKLIKTDTENLDRIREEITT